jgi:hypothetical protein
MATTVKIRNELGILEEITVTSDDVRANILALQELTQAIIRACRHRV